MVSMQKYSYLASYQSAAGAIHRGDNLSRHSPIFVKLNLGSLPIKSSLSQKTPIKPSWSKALSENKLE